MVMCSSTGILTLIILGLFEIVVILGIFGQSKILTFLVDFILFEW